MLGVEQVLQPCPVSLSVSGASLHGQVWWKTQINLAGRSQFFTVKKFRFPDSVADEYTTDYDLAAVTEAVSSSAHISISNHLQNISHERLF